MVYLYRLTLLFATASCFFSYPMLKFTPSHNTQRLYRPTTLRCSSPLSTSLRVTRPTTPHYTSNTLLASGRLSLTPLIIKPLITSFNHPKRLFATIAKLSQHELNTYLLMLNNVLHKKQIHDNQVALSMQINQSSIVKETTTEWVFCLRQELQRLIRHPEFYDNDLMTLLKSFPYFSPIFSMVHERHTVLVAQTVAMEQHTETILFSLFNKHTAEQASGVHAIVQEFKERCAKLPPEVVNELQSSAVKEVARNFLTTLKIYEKMAH